MVELVDTISQRIAQYLEKVGLLERDMENSLLNLPADDEDSLLQLQGASASCRIAMSPQKDKKCLHSSPVGKQLRRVGQLVNTSGEVFANTDEPDKLERLCRYISRPAISVQA